MKSIIDVSSVIYGGHAGTQYRIKGFPVGGIRKLFGIINANLSSSDFALCFDGGEIIKKELLPTYKAGRVPDYSVYAQIDLAKELLTNCDIPFYYDSKYEADDYIYSVCRELTDLGDYEDVVIYSDDRDLACCVTDLISVRNVTSNGICITKANYCDRVVRNRSIPYNTILLWKIFHGDASDRYSGLRIPGITFESMAFSLTEQLDPLIGPEGFTQMAYADYEVFNCLLGEFDGVLRPEDIDALLKQARIVYPYSLPVSDIEMSEYVECLRRGDRHYLLERQHMKMFGMGTFNRPRFDFYCSMLGLNKTRLNRRVDEDSPEAQEFLNLLDLRAKELSSGVMAVERYRRKRSVEPVTPTLENMELPT